MKAAIKRVFRKLRKLLCVRVCDADETTVPAVEDEMIDRLALKQFFARRGVTWPARQKIGQQQDQVWTVKMLHLYPDLSEFMQRQESGNGWQVKMLDLYPDLSEFYC